MKTQGPGHKADKDFKPHLLNPGVLSAPGLTAPQGLWTPAPTRAHRLEFKAETKHQYPLHHGPACSMGGGLPKGARDVREGSTNEPSPYGLHLSGRDGGGSQPGGRNERCEVGRQSPVKPRVVSRAKDFTLRSM